MATIAPFRAWRYNPGQVQLASVVTQPYDKISPEMREKYYSSSPYNLVRIILGKPESHDKAGNNSYTRAAAFFEEWRRQGVFLRESRASIYLYEQQFKSTTGATLSRRGFIALGKLEEYTEGVVHRHEETLAKPKADRLDLLRATCAHFGQIFMLYSDPGNEVEALLAPAANPDLEVTDEYGVRHQLWAISDPALINLVCGKMKDKKLIIADGHHRYETALTYRRERHASDKELALVRQAHSSEGLAPGPELAPYDFAMMTFVNMDSPGLVILPTHRVLHGLDNFEPEELRSKACEYFSIEEVDPAIDAARAAVILREAGRVGTAFLAIMADRVFLIDRPKHAAPPFFAQLSFRQQNLDVVQLHKCLLESVLGLDEDSIRNQQNIRYVRDIADAMEQVRSRQANVAFLINPVRMTQVREIAFAGEVLPQKSTDFYPKLLSGLTIYALE